ncbi:S8 family serine peptidase (plasmid) [Methylocapsa polymorpha]|uniref:S8 family serine peptidase n=1 Tax=Methylocapsa polymorpha TaxID=3080828 RepID=A0ABZ0HXI5_9HYPH|nr:S8 family serine peptidase [Methylocapsa sp. RX1]WOJ91630.1 S8 family serine peptidase [Methylocapsa sp. RX1]
MPSVSPPENHVPTRARLRFIFIVFSSFFLSFSLYSRPAQATCTEAEIKGYCNSRPNFRVADEPLRTTLVTKCVGEHRRRCGLDPISTGIALPVSSAEELDPISTGAVPPIRSAEELDPISTGAVPPIKSAEELDPISTGAVPPIKSAEELDPTSAGAVPPIKSAEELDPTSAGAVPPIKSAEELDPISTGAVPPIKSAEKPQATLVRLNSSVPAATGESAQRRQVTSARRNSGITAADEHRFVPDEVLFEVRPDVSFQTTTDIARRERLQLLAPKPLSLTGKTMYRYRIVGKRTVVDTVAALQADSRITAVQPNYLYTLQSERVGALAEAQYVIPKMRLTEAHAISSGAKTLVAVIDAGVDRTHPEISNAVVAGFDAVGAKEEPSVHGTAVAGIIAAHAELAGVAPQARILAYRAFGGADAKAGTRGTTYDVLAGIEWSALHGARIVNMSFAGPRDPALSRELAAGARRGMIFIAAVGNEGRSAKPLYPAADENVIAVTATDQSDNIFKDSNHCPTTCIAAPGVEVLVAEPDDAYGFLTGTSLAAAHVTGVAALLVDVKPDLTFNGIRTLLFKTARHLNPSAEDQESVAGIVDAYQSLKAIAATVAIESVPTDATQVLAK